MEDKEKALRSRVFGTDLNDCIWAVQEWNIDIRDFSLFLTGESMQYDSDDQGLRNEPGVEYQMSARLIKNLRLLASIDSARPILIHMKTCGGDWTEGMAIYDALRATPNRIVIVNYTHARSMSSLIFQAADKRVMMPNSHFMFHDGELFVGGTYRGTITNVRWAEKERPTMFNIYVERMKERGKFRRWSQENIREMLEEQMEKKEDVFLTAQEAMDWGLADEIFDGNWEQLKKKFPRTRIHPVQIVKT